MNLFKHNPSSNCASYRVLLYDYFRKNLNNASGGRDIENKVNSRKHQLHEKTRERKTSKMLRQPHRDIDIKTLIWTLHV